MNIQRLLSAIGITFFIAFVSIYFIISFYLFNTWTDEVVAIMQSSKDEIEKTNEFTRSAQNMLWMLTGQAVLGFLALLFFLLGGQRRSSSIRVENISLNGNIIGKEGLDGNLDSSDTTGNSSVLKELKEIIREGDKDKLHLLEKILWKICNTFDGVQGAMYLYQESLTTPQVHFVAGYAFFTTEDRKLSYQLGEGLIGQVAKNAHLLNVSSLPEDYTKVVSGLGQANPESLIILPIKNEDEKVMAVIEIASFSHFSSKDERVLEEMALLLAKELTEGEYYSLLPSSIREKSL